MNRFLLFLIILSSTAVFGQFTQSDSLRGGYGNTRNWWDITHYDLNVDFDIQKQTISGKTIISYDCNELTELAILRTLQIDLQDPMIIDSISLNKQPIKLSTVKKVGAAYLIPIIATDISQQNDNKLIIFFHGKPRVAENAPWNGGVVWTKDNNGSPWVTVACQGLGASVWWPCKDSQVDEPKNVDMHFTCPENLVCISNGNFTGKKVLPGNKATYSWSVTNPINNYCMIPYIGDYVNIHEHLQAEKGILEMDYWVIRGNEEKARSQFQDAPRTIKALEYWFGPYPFYEDGYKLVEAPHLGMEHQSAIAYGNRFKNGYLGKDLSGTGQGLKWDFIIVHESGHEWFGNSITSKDIADMWIHESFTNYSETLFMDYWFGNAAGNEYCIGLRKNIQNDQPIIGQYGVQNEGSGDMYYKGANMLHTIRTLVNNDSIFRAMLRKINATFYHKTVTTKEIEQFMIDELNLDLRTIFEQYLRATNPPTLQLKQTKKKLKYRWINCVSNFEMPIIFNNQQYACTRKWKSVNIKQPVEVDKNLYILIK